MNDQVLQLETSIANIKADITVLERALEALKVKDTEILNNLDKSQSSLVSLQIGHTTEITKIKSDLENLEKEMTSVQHDLHKLSTSIETIDTNVKKLSKNVFLNFTYDLDIRKLMVIIILIGSLISSPGLFSYFLKDSDSADAEKINLIIEMLQKELETP